MSKAGFTAVPNWILDDTRIKLVEKNVLIQMLRLCIGNKSECHPSQQMLAIKLGVDRKRIREAIVTLESFGLIKTTTAGGKGRGNVATYSIPLKKWDGAPIFAGWVQKKK